MFGGLRENDRVLKYFCQFILKSLHIHSNLSENASLLLLNGMVMISNEG